jgi:integrase
MMSEALADINRGSYVEASRLTVRTFMHQWAEVLAASVRPSTALRYGQVARTHILPEFGNVPVSKLNPLLIQEFIGRKHEAGYSAATVGLIFTVLRRALAQAVKWRVLSINPSDGVEVPRRTKPEITTWSLEEARMFLTATIDDPLSAVWRLALTSGMRKGELLALSWVDVDLERQTIAVRRTQTRDLDGKLTVGQTKSASGRRQIKLLASTTAALKRHQDGQNQRRLDLGADWNEGGLVFDQGDGAALSPRVVSFRLAEHCKRIGVPSIRFHDLRHSAATLLLGEGVHPKIVSEMLGHSSIAITLDRYSHVSLTMQETAADKLEAALS